ncbi:unnamed protein product [Diatraea saccharalis]|uniref:Carboxylic ester hydrolase n=1 Tax=Diatraea saccharalis TaxID=40085 RepID=A0A9N9W9L5_9NEOP|nr:unnamed protein product [Diatraea saccharalis]
MKYGKRIVLFTLFAMNLVEQPTPYITIEQGTLSGRISEDGSIFEYMGIPYATSNIKTRFKAPLPPPKWEGIYKAIDEMYVCPQPFLLNTIVGKEDCLKLHIYVPAKTKGPLPVMVYIHGGAFYLGNAGKHFYGPEFLVKHDIILVIINYRLGILGFTCLGIEEAPGNAGLKDQIAALRWVKKNIAAFGGDPDNITLFGESAGAASISILLLNDVTLGLFNRVILQSGSSLTSWTTNRQAVWVASLLVKSLGHNTEDPNEIYKILHKLSYRDIIKLKPDKPLGMFSDAPMLGLPCVEKPGIPGNEPVLVDLPYNLLMKNRRNISVIHGSMTREGFIVISGETDISIENWNQKYLFPSDLAFETDNEANKTSSKIREFYFGEDRISRNNIMKLEKMCTELYFQFPTTLEADIMVSSWNVPVYSYIFNYSGSRNIIKKAAGFCNETGAGHGDDILYFFKSRVWPFSVARKDREVIEWLTRMWTNFAKYGYPTPLRDSRVPVKWPPGEKDALKYLYIDDVFRIGPMPNPDSYVLWKEIYDKYRRMDLNYYY